MKVLLELQTAKILLEVKELVFKASDLMDIEASRLTRTGFDKEMLEDIWKVYDAIEKVTYPHASHLFEKAKLVIKKDLKAKKK